MKYDTAQSGGSAFGKTNVVAGQAIVSGDLRALSPEQLEKAKATMREVVAQHLPKTTAELTFDDGYPPMAPTDGNRRAARRVRLGESGARVRLGRGGGPVARRRRRRLVRGAVRADGDRRVRPRGLGRSLGQGDGRPALAPEAHEARGAC